MESNTSRAPLNFYFPSYPEQYSTFQSITVKITVVQFRRSTSTPHIPKRSNAIRHLELDDDFQAAVSVWSYVDRLNASSRIENVTSGQVPEALG